MASSARSPEIMVVDDDEGMLLSWRTRCAPSGYERGDGAVRRGARIAALRERRPALVLLDLQLKDMAGKALLDSLKRESLQVPFIVVTGQGDEKVAVEMMKQGALDYVMKDTGILDLLPTVVRRALAALERERSLAAAEAEWRRLEKEVLDIGERERQRIGADLHDGRRPAADRDRTHVRGAEGRRGRARPEAGPADREDRPACCGRPSPRPARWPAGWPRSTSSRRRFKTASPTWSRAPTRSAACAAASSAARPGR